MVSDRIITRALHRKWKGENCPPSSFEDLNDLNSHKATLSLRINGATILVADIDEVDDIVNMWTVPRQG